jgi:plastocyanin
MKISYVAGVIVVVLIVGGIFWFMSQNASPSAPQQSAMQMPASQGQQTTSQATAPVTAPVVVPASAQAVSIAIKNFAFNPSQITVKAGTKVTWTNNDSATHTVTSDNGTFNSGDVNPGGSYSFTFTNPGTYQYHCSIHPNMTASVIVTQ